MDMKGSENQDTAATQADGYEPTWARPKPATDQRRDEPYDPLFKSDSFE